MPTPSAIQILYESDPGVFTDITNVVLFQTARFQCQANAVPGDFEFQVKDVDRNLSFVTGREVYAVLDGIKLFGGILLQASRVYAFPVVDSSVLENVTARQWQLRGADFNIWFDKRVIRDTADYKRGILIPGSHMDGALIRDFLPTYLDVPPGVDMSTDVDDIELFGTHTDPNGTRVTGVRLIEQGKPWRDQMEIFAARSAAVYYIDADKKLQFHALEDVVSPWNFVDYRPNGVTTIGVRDVSATQDGAPIVTDALVWGGLEQLASADTASPSGIFFARYPDPPADDAAEQDAIDAQASSGRWQYAEVNFQRGDDQRSVENRARAIIMGPPGTAGGQIGGLRFPIWNIGLTWFAHHVPSQAHIQPGHIATIILYVMGEDVAHPLVQTLPLRSMSLTFPQVPPPDGGPDALTYAQFQGSFGLSYADSRYLWKFLIGSNRKALDITSGVTGDASEATAYGSFGAFTPTGTPNSVRTEFAIPFPYVGGTTRVYLNGLLQRLGLEYRETDPAAGKVVFFTAPVTGDSVFIEARTAESTRLS